MTEIKKIKGFTPGPWDQRISTHADISNNHWHYNVIGTRLGCKYKIAKCPFIDEDADKVEAAANASLIAYAPELYSLALEQQAEIMRLRELALSLWRESQREGYDAIDLERFKSNNSL